ncbi:MAG: lipopolysaccharide heptosyltransferase II [Salinisphaeraceae bacterium]|nr:lipopolysaccharide heptosyltransferase II [Salinisphaeraceae bacterium]
MTKKILIVGPAWVGDMVMVQSLTMRLKEQYPDCEIDILAPGWSLPIIERMPQVRRGIELPIGHGELGLGKLWRLGRSLRTDNYDQAIVLPRKLKAALVPFFASIPQRTGYRGEFRYWLINDVRPLDKSILTRTVQRFVALGEPQPPTQAPETPVPVLEVDEANRDRLVKTLELDMARPAVGFMPGAEYGPAKQWPAAYYGQLAKGLVEQGQQVWIFGSAKEAPLGEEIRTAAGDAAAQVINLCGKTALADVVDLLATCRRVVTNDSGLMHVAAATGTRILAIYGSSTPDYTPPLTDNAEIFYLRLDCSPCFERVCPLGHTNCLNQILPEEVLARL